MVDFKLVLVLHGLNVAPPDLVLAEGAEDLADDVLSTDEVFFDVYTFHNVVPNQI